MHTNTHTNTNIFRIRERYENFDYFLNFLLLHVCLDFYVYKL